MGFDNDTEYSLAVRPVEAVVGGDIAPYINAYFDASWADAEGLAKDRVLAAGEGVPPTTQVVGVPYTVGNEARGLEGTFGWSWQIYAVPITVDDSGCATTVGQPITITFTPTDDFVGIASVAYTASGIGGYSSTSTISVDVQAVPVGEPPVARDDRAATVSGTPVTVAVLDNDSEIDAEAEVTIIESTDAQGDWVVEPSRSVTFTPASAFVGAAEATYRVENPDGQFSTAIITIDVAAPEVPVPDPGTPVDPAPAPRGAPAEPAPPAQPSPAPEGRPAASGTHAGAGATHTQLARTGAGDPSVGAMFGGGLLLLGVIGVAAASRLRVRR
ncbi:Ig-like domain-containing protein [Leucobacter sp. NPDC077196]|uniref:Ig-like domain-containing protein n=1 Tax=Leucobacter sp. NPDC077196 TaxID=3154959 RepID=UPI0034476168